MPGIARSRRQAASWSRARRSIRPAATSRATRRSARARPCDRPQASSSAGATPARTSAAGTSRSPVCGHRRPHRRTIRRSMAAARPYSMSCSQTAQASASKGSGRRRTRRCGRARTERPMSGSSRKRVQNSRRSSSTPSAKRVRAQRLLAGRPVRAPGAEHDPVAGRLGDAGDDRGHAHVHQALLHAAAPPPDAVGAHGRQAVGPLGADVGTDLDHGGAALYVRPRRSARARAEGCPQGAEIARRAPRERRRGVRRSRGASRGARGRGRRRGTSAWRRPGRGRAPAGAAGAARRGGPPARPRSSPRRR